MISSGFEDAVSAAFAGVPLRSPTEKPSTKNAGSVRKPICCEDCGKTFRYRSSMREHQRHHTGEMPFQCPHPGCTFKFKWRSSLSNHRRYHKTDQAVRPRPELKRAQSKRRRPVVQDDTERAALPDVAQEALNVDNGAEDAIRTAGVGQGYGMTTELLSNYWDTSDPSESHATGDMVFL